MHLSYGALKLTSKDLLKLGVIDRIIYEPMGGAQNNPERMIKIVKSYLIYYLKTFIQRKDIDFKAQRAQKFEALGFYKIKE